MTRPADPWNPDQYARFRSERAQPFEDLLAMVRPRSSMRALDLGSGTGELTERLHRHLAASETLGVDNSPNMLERAKPLAGGGLRFELADVAELQVGSGWDLVFSNAALQWLPDHPELFARIARFVAAGGQLAVQMPANHDHPSHTLAHDLAREEPFSAALGGDVRQSPVLAPERYAELLYRLGFASQSVRLHVYAHVLAGPEDVVEWVKGTLLTHYERRLSPELYARFLEAYTARLLPVLGSERPHFYPFKRILLWAERGAR